MTIESSDLELKGVAKAFTAVPAVDHISLTAQRGEFLSLLGPSGCGKTTTLRLIAGFERPDSGEILLKGKNVAQVPPYRRDVNTVFQHYALFPHLTVFENIAYALTIRRRPKSEIAPLVTEMLRTVDLVGYEARYPHQLSGGQQQRVALARALINRPAVLLLDEPLGALDLQVRRRMQIELKRIQRNVGITFIYVTHDQEEALTLSDRIAVMNRGRIEQLGAPRDVYDHPASRFVLEFVGSCNVLRGNIVRRNGTAVEIRTSAGARLWARDGAELAIDQPVVVGIRPEKIVLSSDQKSDREITGTIVETIFQGAFCHYRVRLEGGDELVVCQQTLEGDGARLSWHPGDAVHMSWSLDNSLAFSA